MWLQNIDNNLNWGVGTGQFHLQVWINFVTKFINFKIHDYKHLDINQLCGQEDGLKYFGFRMRWSNDIRIFIACVGISFHYTVTVRVFCIPSKVSSITKPFFILFWNVQSIKYALNQISLVLDLCHTVE